MHTASSSPSAHRLRRLSRVALGSLLGALALCSIGATYQAVATRSDAVDHPPPGRLVDVGGYRLHIDCTGPITGGPTLVLDHGGGGLGATDFAYVQPRLAEFARVCSYDRAGYGWSDASPRPRTVEHETEELHTLLERAEIPGPYVLVADSLGGYTSRLFATRHPDEVAGLVLIDVSTENTWTHPEIRAFNQQFGMLLAFCSATTPIGVWRLLGETGLLQHPFPEQMPSELRDAALSITFRPDYCSTLREETGLWNLEVSAQTLRDTRRSLGDLPLVVLTAGAGYPDDAYRQGWLDDQDDLPSLSARSEHILVEDASHYDILTTRADVVVAAVRDLLGTIGAEAV